ncbi:ribonuclease iii [Agrilactobacillus composti DSM 18527 = JCM 14202]|uniref:Ribonuclease 3 n=2 Tax=Agrilactobacillus TaxID=2767875 RepID=X0PTB3_9LACO|nr:ribonuclease iii [Agrilactobacillus composti DSM 18527 = JCM 14202]GAF41242.1 ribonuclease III [Agrilactobacillus composti DSM 18527 = JCM 14202]
MMIQDLANELRLNYGIEFKNLSLLDEAFTHSSYMNEHRELNIKDNERLEFLGDAVLELTVSEHLYKQFPDLPEGKLTRMRASIVCTKGFSSFSREAHFDKYVRLGKGEEQMGARNRDTLLEDLFEAFNGALYLDQGKDAVVKFIQQIIFPKIDVGAFNNFTDYKTALQERLQVNGDVQIAYHTLSEDGPAHQRVFHVNVSADGEILGEGQGASKKRAEQAAAKLALDKINENQVSN